MCNIENRLTVFFDEPFWTAVYEVSANGELQAARIVFGAEPKDAEVYEYFLKNFTRLALSPPVAEQKRPAEIRNPKRRQRAIRNGLIQTGTGTKAQQALQRQREQTAVLWKEISRERKKRRTQEKFELRRRRKKEKHRGK